MQQSEKEDPGGSHRRRPTQLPKRAAAKGFEGTLLQEKKMQKALPAASPAAGREEIVLNLNFVWTAGQIPGGRNTGRRDGGPAVEKQGTVDMQAVSARDRRDLWRLCQGSRGRVSWCRREVVDKRIGFTAYPR